MYNLTLLNLRPEIEGNPGIWFSAYGHLWTEKVSYICPSAETLSLVLFLLIMPMYILQYDKFGTMKIRNYLHGERRLFSSIM